MTTIPGQPDSQLKVIGLGLGRTGTLSLCTALEILGFGPCHHPVLLGVDTDFWRKIAKAAQDIDNVTSELLNDIFRGYVSALDSTTAVLAKAMYKAYPDAKFILTVRDPAKWVQSIKNTSLKYFAEYTQREARIASGTASEEDLLLSRKMKEIGITEWTELYHGKYHQGRLDTDPEGEFFRHNQYITQLIPSEKLLVFDVAEGWKPLVEFLGVSEPDQPFPRVNDPSHFEEIGRQWWKKLMDSEKPGLEPNQGQ